MQSPSASDPGFKSFLDKLQEQNNRGFLTQVFQLKTEREIAGEDNDKREQQLDNIDTGIVDLGAVTSRLSTTVSTDLSNISDDIIESTIVLDNILTAVTGINFDIAPLVDIGQNQTKLLDESFKELSLIRKLTEGSVEYSKEMAGYRNTSGRDVTNEISGKTSKTGQVIDFETARDALSAEGVRARKANAFDLKPITYTPGKTTGAAVGSDLGKPITLDNPINPGKSDTPADTGSIITLDNPINPGKSDTPADTGSIITLDNPINPTRKKRLRGVTGDVQPRDVEETDKRGFFDTFKDEVKATPGRIRDHLIGYEEPPEDKKKEREGKVSSPAEKSPEAANPEGDNVTSSGEALADAAKSDLELSKQMLETTKEQLTTLKEIRDALAPKTPAEITDQKGAPSAKKEEEEKGSLVGDLASGAMDLIGNGKSKAGAIGSKLAKFATSKTGKVLGSVAAVGLGAYTAYQGYSAAEDSKQAKLEDVQAKVDAGQLSPEDAAAQRKDIGNSATVEKSGAVGEGTGMAAGAIAGASLGATIGSVVPGVGTAIGGLAGGAIGAFAGSKAGKYVGEKVGSGINAVKGFFGGEEKAPGAATKEAVSGSTAGLATKDSSLEELQAARAAHLKRAPDPEGSAHAIMHHKNVLGTIDKAIEAKKSNPTEGESRGAYSVRVSKSDAHEKRAKDEKYDSESVEALQEQRIRVAERGPATDSLQSKKAHEGV